MALPALKRVSYAEYLAIEAATGVKHEYRDGAVVAMAGGTAPHADLGGAVFGMFWEALKGRPCRPSNSDQKIRVQATSLATYPDVSVTCRPRVPDTEDPNALVNPTVLVEVLSLSTEAYDRGEKFWHYRQIPSLREYVLVGWRAPQVEVYTRNDDESWTLRVYGPGATVPLPSIDVALAVDDLYRDVELPPREPGPGIPRADPAN